ncbi:hypothetical protein [Haloglomus halophilum]|uniref:hypothetical protein n=1 Tax=Haloglomus halophilum TaxID=2962672 RepID=UPI0020C98ABD|nr:hypothetical protein [Haloglomus halophilum]
MDPADGDDHTDGSGKGEQSSPAPADVDAAANVEDRLVDAGATSLTPTEYQRLKDLVNGDRLEQIKGHSRRYLVAGAGGDGEAADRRGLVCGRLDDRRDPPAVAVRLEDFGLTREEMALWARLFDVLCGMATHVVAVLEDFDGGYVWELGLLYAPSYRAKAWVPQRVYDDDRTQREHYENGMAAAHLEHLSRERVFTWATVSDLRAAVDEIP